MHHFTVILLVVGVIIALIGIFVMGRFLNIWIQALSSGARVSFFDLIGMWLRKVPPQLIVSARISAMQAGVVDKLYLTVEPVLFGEGIKLFNQSLDIKLKLESVKKLSPQTLLLEYQPQK